MADPGNAEVFESRVAQSWFADGILYVKAKPGARITLADARQDIDMGPNMTGGQPFVMLIDMREMAAIEREARSHYSESSRGGNSHALALIVRSPVTRVIASFFIGLNKPTIPVRIFDDEGAAVTWLREHLDAVAAE